MLQNNSILKKYLSTPMFVALLLVVFSLLINVPIPFLYTALNQLALFSFVLFLGFYTMKSLGKKRASRLLILTLLLLIVPVFGAIQANIYFGQPLIYGLLAERVKLFATAGIVSLVMLENGFLDFKKMEQIVIRMAIVIFFLLFILNVFIPPELFEQYDFVIKTASKGYRYKLNQSLIVILYFYSLIRYVSEKDKKYLLMVLLILFYLVFLYKARSLTLSLVLASSFYLVQKVKLQSFIYSTIISVTALSILFYIGLILFPNQLNLVGTLFKSALNVFIGGEVTDSSAMSRISQFEVASTGIANHPIFGNGFLSSQWNNGWEGKYGHFYPSDIGWMGALYLYGIVGTLILCIPYFLSLKYALDLKKRKVEASHFVQGLFYTLLYFFIHSATAGFFVKKLGIIVFIFSLLYYHYYTNTEKKKL